MWQQKKVSVVLPTYNEKDSIRESIESFYATGVVDEVIVVNNNAAPGTSEEVALTPATEIFEEKQGYGHACQCGMASASGDYIILCEPDGTFLARDVYKLLSYVEDFDLILGTRTEKDLIWRGANMGPFLRWGNWAVAKLMEVLFNTTSLSDVGCTMRLISKEALAKIQPEFTIGGSHFGPEMMLLGLTRGLKVVQIPVNYTPRVGVSSVTGSKLKAFFLGVRMILLILQFRLMGGFLAKKPRQGATRLRDS